MSNLLVIGGSNGLGASMVDILKNDFSDITIVDVNEPIAKNSSIKFIKFDLFKNDVSLLKEFIEHADSLIVTAGIGTVKSFSNYSLTEIEKVIDVNLTSCLKILNLFFPSLMGKENKECMVIGSFAGDISSPLFSVYGASKSALNKACESLNVELRKCGSMNRITCIKPLNIKNTSFDGEKTDLAKLRDISLLFIDAMHNKIESFYYDEKTCLEVLKRYQNDPIEFGNQSYDYKISSGRVNNDKRIKVGYLSGTFDLFHIGHLNLLRRAKEYCDYLVVGVHESGSWKGKETFIPFEDRLEIVSSIKYVDKAIKSFPEDSDAWDLVHYDYLFVGSDYKGSERFKKYEEVLKGKAKIIYFDYTKRISSTKIRDSIKNQKK